MISKKTVSGKYIPKTTVLKVVRELEGLYGIVRPEDLVTYAEPEDSPIHNLFEWDNTKAADGYRLWQARKIITSVEVKIGGTSVQAYQNIIIRTNEGKKQGYFSMEKILSERDMYEQLLQTAFEELRYWRTKYGSLQELRSISKKIQKFFEDLDADETKEE